MSSEKKVIVVTGGNSGVGLACCLELAAQANIHLILTGHDQQHIDAAVAKCRQVADASTIIEGALADLASLKMVKTFCESLIARNLQLFCLVCNAGLAIMTKELTEDGFERVLQVNHIGHFLMTRLLQAHTKRIVLLGSAVHDPAYLSQTPPPNVSDLDQLAVGYESFDGSEVYSTTKLFATVVGKALAWRYPDGPEIVSYSPGFIPETGLYRHGPVNMTALLPVFKAQGVKVTTAKFSGFVLARVVSADSWEEYGWTSGDYMSLGIVTRASMQANDETLAQQIWEKSEEWIARFK